MSKSISLTAKDGFTFSAYQSTPEGKPRGAIVVLQETWGVNPHIRSVVDRYAKLGYLAVAPRLFDRAEPNFEVGYEPKELDIGRAVRKRVPVEHLLLDTQATIDHARQFGKVATIGFSMGAGLAFWSATRLVGVACAVSYYPHIEKHLEEKPKVPMLIHFGDTDEGLPLDEVERTRKAQPDATIYIHHGGHNFNCDDRADSFNAESAMIAACRTQEFLLKHVG